ncbi:MAG: hypothetical protein NVSMB24_28780 [Mucilaginibacter sp.]
MRTIFFCFFCYLSGWVQLASAQNSDWELYNRYNHKLNYKNLKALAVDSKGNKWIITDSGLVKFNGVVNTLYNYKNSGLPKYPTIVAVDKVDNIWIGTYYGVAKFDGVKWSVFNEKNTGWPAHFNYINVVSFDQAGNPWIGTDAGVAKFDGTQWTSYTRANSGYSGRVSAIAAEANGTTWFATDSGLVKFNGNSWYRYNKANSELPEDKIKDIAIDKNGNKWLAVDNWNLVKFDGTSWKIYKNAILDFGIDKITVDNNNDLWIAGSKGVLKFDGNTFTEYNSGNSRLPWGIYTRVIAIDAGGNRWIATEDGLVKMNAVPAVIKRDTLGWAIFNKTNSGLRNDNIYRLAIDQNGNKWIGSYAGLVKYDGNVTWSDPGETDSTRYLHGDIMALATDFKKNLWVADNSGLLARYDGSSWLRFKKLASRINSIAVDGVGNKWLGTRDGLIKTSDNESIVYNKSNNSLPSDEVNSVVIDGNGIKWVGTDGGLAKFDGQNWTVYKHDDHNLDGSLSGDGVTSIAIDAADNKWIGTREGVAKLTGTAWTIYRMENSGLPANDVQAISIDDKGNKWIGTGKGVAKFDGANWTVYNKANSGLPDDDITEIKIDQNGVKWIGTHSGLAAFSNAALTSDPAAAYKSALLSKYIAELGKTPMDNELRRKIVALAGQLKPPPAIPEGANEKFVMGITFRDQKDYVSSVSKLNEALMIAPWWAEAYKELGLSLELTKKYDDAINAFELVLLSQPTDAMAQSVKNEITIIKAKKETGSKENALGKWVGLWAKKPRSVLIDITKNENGEYKGMDSRGNTIDLEFKNNILRYQRIGYQYDLRISDDGKTMFGGCYKLSPYTEEDEAAFKKAGMQLKDIQYDVSDNISRQGFSLSYTHPDDGEISNTDNFSFSGEWRDEQGNVVINITKTSNGFVGSISDDGVWVLNDPKGGKNSAGNFFRLDNFWTSGNTVHFVKTQYFRDTHKATWGPITSTLNLTLLIDGNTLKGTGTTTTNLGSSTNYSVVLYKRD